MRRGCGRVRRAGRRGGDVRKGRRRLREVVEVNDGGVGETVAVIRRERAVTTVEQRLADVSSRPFSSDPSLSGVRLAPARLCAARAAESGRFATEEAGSGRCRRGEVDERGGGDFGSGEDVTRRRLPQSVDSTGRRHHRSRLRLDDDPLIPSNVALLRSEARSSPFFFLTKLRCEADDGREGRLAVADGREDVFRVSTEGGRETVDVGRFEVGREERGGRSEGSRAKRGKDSGTEAALTTGAPCDEGGGEGGTTTSGGRPVRRRFLVFFVERHR